MILSDVFSKMLYVFGGCVSSTQTESQSSSDSDHSHESGKQSLSKSSGDSQLIQSGQNGERPDGPLGQSAQEMSGRAPAALAEPTTIFCIALAIKAATTKIKAATMTLGK